MKTRRFLTAAVLMGVMAMFTSCSKSDDNSGGGSIPSAPDVTPVSANYTYTATIVPSMLDYVDVTVDYYDESGKVKTEKITDKEWKKSFTTKLPVTIAARLNLSLKSDIEDYTKFDYIRIESSIAAEGNLFNKAGGIVGGIIQKDGSNWLEIPGENFEKFITELGSGYRKFFIEYDAAGKKTEGSW